MTGFGNAFAQAKVTIPNEPTLLMTAVCQQWANALVAMKGYSDEDAKERALRQFKCAGRINFTPLDGTLVKSINVTDCPEVFGVADDPKNGLQIPEGAVATDCGTDNLCNMLLCGLDGPVCVFVEFRTS